MGVKLPDRIKTTEDETRATRQPVVSCNCLQNWNTCAGEHCGPWASEKKEQAFEQQMKPWRDWWAAAEREREDS